MVHLAARRGNPLLVAYLIDQGGKASKEFHIEGIPRTFVFDRDGKLVAEAVDQRTWRQFLVMLSKTDLHP